MKLYVGNLSFKTTQDQLRALFEQHGSVRSAELVMDRMTGRPRGFGFVEMDDSAQAQAAISALHGKNIDGRDLTVNEARPREERSFGGGGGGGGGGGIPSQLNLTPFPPHIPHAYESVRTADAAAHFVPVMKYCTSYAPPPFPTTSASPNDGPRHGSGTL